MMDQIPHRSNRSETAQIERRRQSPTNVDAGIRSRCLLLALTVLTLAMASLNFLVTIRDNYNTNINYSHRSSSSQLENTLQSPNSKPSYLIKASSISSFWWPSPTNGGLLGKLYQSQNPNDCSSRDTRFFVWRSRTSHDKDTRGLTAWGHAAMSHLLHALTDGDQFDKFGGRVLIQDEKLWPMAKGCEQGPETRECYFEPLTKCKLSDVDPIPLIITNSSSSSSPSAHVLQEFNEEYDRSVRTLYSTQKFWFRPTGDPYSFTGLPGGSKAHSQIAIIAVAFAYYFNPRPWLRKEIDERLRKSIPADLDPDRTIGVPLRRSDKCFGHSIKNSARGEMDCPSLDTYLDGVKQFLLFDPSIENIIITSEDRSACDEFISLIQRHLPNLRIVTNVGDIQQGTGSGSQLESYTEGATNKAVIASALTSLHMHLCARYFVITTKSTWTSTIAVMARVYGFATSDVFVTDIESNHNSFSEFAKTGCFVRDLEHVRTFVEGRNGV